MNAFDDYLDNLGFYLFYNNPSWKLLAVAIDKITSTINPRVSPREFIKIIGFEILLQRIIRRHSEEHLINYVEKINQCLSVWISINRNAICLKLSYKEL